MARTELERVVVPSLLDRLTDLDPKTPGERPPTREESMRDFRRGVARDIESLLNTRRTMEPAPTAFAEVRRSVYEYGIPDTTGIPVATADGRDRLVQSLRDSLQRFEPRLANIQVKLIDANQTSAPQVRFVIEGILLLDEEREKVQFDAVLEVAKLEYDVSANESPAPPR